MKGLCNYKNGRKYVSERYQLKLKYFNEYHRRNFLALIIFATFSRLKINLILYTMKKVISFMPNF